MGGELYADGGVDFEGFCGRGRGVGGVKREGEEVVEEKTVEGSAVPARRRSKLPAGEADGTGCAVYVSRKLEAGEHRDKAGKKERAAAKKSSSPSSHPLAGDSSPS